ncbi:MAB_1171c family putative transporter [Streptomyces sp. NPDC006879]|uniref:MAB_1171c family putative transporter n=1 Tax=Streptomyces sp. NPDC006879 TaxID=3364767 RepID=UPI0036832217
MNGPDYYIPAGALAISLAFKLPALRSNWRDPLLRSVCALLALAALVFAFAAPPTIAAVNRWTGIPNFSAPLVYCLITAFSASCLILIVNWRGGPAEDTRRVSRRWMALYGAVIVALVILFALGEAPQERLRDLDTYYANTPYVREMIVLYLMAHSLAAVVMTYLCLRWSLQVRGWLRCGLVIIVIGYLFNLSYDCTKIIAVVARWFDTDWDFLSTYLAPPLASVGALVSAIGFVVPLVFQRVSDSWRNWTTYRQLGPLWHELQGAAPQGTSLVRIAWWSPAELRITQRESDIHDGFLHLGPYFDQGFHSGAYHQALAEGAGPETARAVADAAMVAAALHARTADPEGRVIGNAQEQQPPSGHGPRDLVRISQALRHSSVVEAARRRAAVRSGSGPNE